MLFLLDIKQTSFLGQAQHNIHRSKDGVVNQANRTRVTDGKRKGSERGKTLASNTQVLLVISDMP